MKNRLRRSGREAVRNRYASSELLYKMMSKGARELEKQMAHFRFAVEELFVEVMTMMDAVKEDAESASGVYEDYWNTLYCDLRDLDTADSDDGELRLATSEVVYLAMQLLAMCQGRRYTNISACLMGQLAECHPEAFDELNKLFMPEVWRLDEDKVKARIQAYMEDEEEWISDDIADMLENLPDDKLALEEECKTKPTKDGSQLTNRQLVILFECLLDITLNAQYTNIKALSHLLSKVSGNSEGGIRTLIYKGVDYEAKQTIDDVKLLAELVNPIQPKLAEKLRNNIDEE